MTEPDSKVGVPQWLFAMFVAAFMSLGGAGGMALIALRDLVLQQQSKIEALEKRQTEVKDDSKRLDKIEAKLDIILDRVLPNQKGKQ